MSPATIALSPRAAIRIRRVLIAVTLALSFTSVSCGSPESKTEVRGVVEVVAANDASSEVGLIEPICITNTPTQKPC